MRYQHRYPHLLVRFKRHLTTDEMEVLTAIPGVREKRSRVRAHTVLQVPHHGIAVVQHYVTQLQLPLKGADWSVEAAPQQDWPYYLRRLEQAGEVQPWVVDGFLTPYQKDAIVSTAHQVGAHLWHPTGSGKTLTGILWCLLGAGPIIVVTRAAARIQYGREFTKYTQLRAHVIRPTTKKNPTTLEDYLQWCKDNEQRQVVVVGWESLTHHIEDLVRIAAGGASLIFDESHRGKSSKRWKAVPLPQPSSEDDAELFYLKQETEAKRKGGFIPEEGSSQYSGPNLGRVMVLPQLNTTSAAARLSRASYRVINTTATPIKDRVRDLWAQLDLAEPHGWGNASCWMFRYCDAKAGRYGGLDTTGSSNQEELAMRLEGVVHRVDYQTTHQHLPKKRRQSIYISPEDQCRATAGFAAEMKGAKRRGPSAVLEVRIAQAASKKRRAVLGMVEDHISSGHKVTIFTGRRRDVDKLGQDIQKLKMAKKHGAEVWYAHGGTNDVQRAEIVRQYGISTKPCVLVATGASFGESVDGLQCTDAALFVSLPYTPGDLRQWEGRFTRLGQTRPVVICYVIAEDTVDEHIADIIITKLDPVRQITKDDELAEAEDILAGIDDEEAIMASILEKIGA